MVKTRLWQLNLLLSLLFTLLLALRFLSALRSEPVIVSAEESCEMNTLVPEPQRWFASLLKHSAGIKPLLYLASNPYQLRLPDLSGALSFHGTNMRPDAASNQLSLFFSLGREGQTATSAPDAKLYLLYDEKSSNYLFSPENRPTPFSFSARPLTGSVEVTFYLTAPNGCPVTEPKERRRFILPEKEMGNSSAAKWEIGKWRADATLLARQRARWYGQDQFINDHGGAEESELIGRERIDFGEGEERYSLYVAQGEALSWKEGRWQKLPLGEQSRGLPLLVVRAIEERLLRFELWDCQGKNRITVNLLKAVEPWNPKNLENDFKFLATRSRAQYLFEVRGERMVLAPHDWLFLAEEGWKKITSLEQLEAIVNRTIAAPLFIFEGVKSKEGRQLLSGQLYNSTRSQLHTVEISIASQAAIIKQLCTPENGLDEEEEEEETVEIERHQAMMQLKKLKG